MAGGFILGCNIKGRDGAALTIPHLLYADDTIIFCEAKEEQLLHHSWILLWFEASSKLKINLNKSELIPVGAVEIWMHWLLNWAPSNYLFGPTLGSHPQVCGYLGQHRGENAQEIGPLEKKFYLKRREDHLDKEHSR